jgi:hypothetical protein
MPSAQGRRVVDAHLAEIGVHGGVEHQAVVQNKLCVQPAIALQMLVLKVRIIRVYGVYLAQVAGQKIRFHLKVLAMLDIAEAFGGDVLGQAAGDGVFDLRPVGLLIGMGDIPLEDNAPGPRLPGIGLFEIQAGERNPHEHNVSLRRAFPPGVPHRIKGVVGAVLLAPKTIALDAEGIAVKQKRAPLVVEGIEHDLDIVVIAQGIAGQHVRPEQARRLVFTDKRGEEVFAGVAQIGDGWLGDRPAVLGITLDEVADAEHLFRGRGADCRGQEIVEVRLAIQPRDDHAVGVGDGCVNA